MLTLVSDHLPPVSCGGEDGPRSLRDGKGTTAEFVQRTPLLTMNTADRRCFLFSHRHLFSGKSGQSVRLSRYRQRGGADQDLRHI